MVMSGESFEFSVPAEAAGKLRLDVFLVAQLPQLSRARVQSLIKEGQVHVNGKVVKPSVALSCGDLITGAIPEDKPAEAQPEDLPLTILYEDDHLAVLDKASGMVVHPAEGNESGTLVNALLHRFGPLSSIGGVARPGIVHRLDKETSGCIVVARNDETHRSLSEQFSERTTRKIYLAVVQGTPQPGSGTVDTYLGRNPHDRQKMAVLEPPAGKHAVTDYRVVHSLGMSSLVRCHLHTGRTHQIRVHLKHLGHPLLGDATYGRPSRQQEVPRVMLHGWKLSFTHPATQQRMYFTAPIPAEFRPWLPTPDFAEADA
jgi:23S rRNA pseudouridine1911/1915/1917 synthase